ncbi:MAG: hypothetical protein ACRBBR_14150 [Cellvibrionaceae bacterium]
MTEDYNRPKALEGIYITSAIVKSDHEFAFIGQIPEGDDPWKHIPTFVIFCDTRKQGDDRWDVQELDYLTGSGNLIGCYSEKPEPAWVFGFNFPIQGGKESLLIFDNNKLIEKDRIPDNEYRGETLISSFRSLNAINNGYIYAVSGFRNVWQRGAKKEWEHLNHSIPQPDYYGQDERLASEHGFNAIDGFTDNDLYACGGYADLWHYDGNEWRQLELPTNAKLKKICCGGDKVYITTNMNTVLEGRNNQWKVIEQDVAHQRFMEMAWYRDRCYITTPYGLYEVKDGVFAEAEIAKDSPGTFGRIDARGDTLLCVSPENEISYYDGSDWHKLIYRDRPAKDPNKPSLMDMVKEYEKNINKP